MSQKLFCNPNLFLSRILATLRQKTSSLENTFIKDFNDLNEMNAKNNEEF